MKIIYVEINDLNAFAFARIKKLTATFTETLQIILGTNGSGKTNLLKQLSPLPPPRSDYGENGYRRLVIKHQGDTYELVSDFSNKTSPHAFIKNGKNLNEGGTTGVQVEFVEDCLGWTQEVQNIAYGTYDFCKMTVGARKALLLTSNPANLGFILDYFKKAGSKVRGLKSNLAHLEERKALLESKLLDDATIAHLTEEKETLVKNTFTFTDLMGRVKSFISMNRVEGDPEAQWKTLITQIRDTSTYIKRTLPQWKSVDRTKPVADQLKERESQLNLILGRLMSQNEHLTDITAQLTESEFALKELSQHETATAVRLRIDALRKRISQLEKIKTDTPIPEPLLDESKGVLVALQSILDVFIDCPVTLITRRHYSLKTQKLQAAEMRIQGYHYDINKLNGDIATLEKSITLRLSDLPQSNCAKEGCLLYVNFKNSYENTLSALSRAQHRKEHLTSRLNKAVRYVSLQTEQLNTLSVYMTACDKLFSFITEHDYLKPLFQHKDTLRMLQTNPNVFLHRTEQLINASYATYEYKKQCDLLYKEELDLSKTKDLSELEKQRLEKTYKTLTQKKQVLVKHIRELTSQQHQYSLQISQIETYQKIYEKMTHLMSDLNTVTSAVKQEEENKFLSSVLHDMERENNRLFSRIGEINIVLQEQGNIKSRYTEEVLNQLDRLEREKKNWEDLEYALNKIPHDHTVAYLNAIIRLINHYISMVFTYDFQLLQINSEKTLDYKFPYCARLPDQDIYNDVSDISHCSLAQTEIVNFTFALALRKIKQLTDYPLFTDEIGSSFDVVHKTQVLDLLKHLIVDDEISQMFLVNHHALVHEGMTNGEVLILNDANIMKPASYNEHVDIEMR